MKILVRTAPIPKGDDSAPHDDVMDFDIPMFEEKESYHYKDYVCEDEYKQRLQNNHGVCKECKEKIDKIIPFKVPKEV